MDESVHVTFHFRRQLTMEDLNYFEAAGGEVTYIYETLAYGFNGFIKRGKIPGVVAHYRPALIGSVLGRPVQARLYLATQLGRVRQVWAKGYTGSTNITIGIIDSGISGSHTDLTGRQKYWVDLSTNHVASAVDYLEHGTHVAGIALGTGAASGTHPVTLKYSQGGTIPLSGVFPEPLEIPDLIFGTGNAAFRWDATLRWNGATNGRSVFWVMVSIRHTIIRYHGQ